MLVNALSVRDLQPDDPFSVVAKEFVPFDLQTSLGKFLNTEKFLEIPNLDTKYRISGLSKMCPIEQFLLSKKTDAKIYVKTDDELQMTFDIGHAFHSLVQNKWLGKMKVLWGDWKCTECGNIEKDKFQPDFCNKCFHKSVDDESSWTYVEKSLENVEKYTTGHPDGIIIFEGIKYVLELKSSNTTVFDLITKRNRPLEDHLDQINSYMDELKIDRGIILYFDKGTSRIRQFHVTIDRARVDRLLNKIVVTKESQRTGKAPDLKYRMCANKTCARYKMCDPLIRTECFNLK